MGYTSFDRLVAWWRFRVALRHIQRNSRVCDIGCGPGAPFLQWARARVSFGVGLDYRVSKRSMNHPPIVLANVMSGLPLKSGSFDHAIMLAVLEHLRNPTITLQEAFRILAPGGSLIITWPDQTVDRTLGVLHRMRMISEEMELEGHGERIATKRLLAMLQEIGFEHPLHHQFELGLNNLVVAYKPLEGQQSLSQTL